MIHATCWNEKGQIEVHVIDANQEQQKVLVQPVGQRLSGFWWDNVKQVTVNRSEISNIRFDCQCGTEICPDDPCCWNCGKCWREKISDEDDAE